MEVVEIARRDGGVAKVSHERVADLEGRMRGRVGEPGDRPFERACAIWNGMIDRQPSLVARCEGQRDVVEAVKFAGEHDLLVSVRGGGHNVAGHAICDEGLTIDLTLMNSVHVNSDTGTVRVGPGCRWSDVDRETQLFGLAVPNGIVSTTGVAGLTLGGGFGWLSRKWGFTCDNLRSVDVVTADGQTVRASREQNSELFWGLRGGGGNFGVVTSFEFQARPVGPEVVAGITIHPREDAERAFELFREVTADAPEEMTCLLTLRNAPPAPFVDDQWHGKPIAGLVVCHTGPIEEARRAVAPIRDFGEPVGQNIGVKPFAAHQQMLDGGQPSGRNYYWKSEYVDDLTDEFRDTLFEQTDELPSPFSAILLMHLGGAISRSPDGETAASHRDAQYVLNIASGWEDQPDEGPVAWARRFWEAVQPHAHGGSYVNFLTDDEGGDRVRGAYDEETWERLISLKREFDPENRFRVNQNIPAK